MNPRKFNTGLLSDQWIKEETEKEKVSRAESKWRHSKPAPRGAPKAAVRGRPQWRSQATWLCARGTGNKGRPGTR